MSYKSIHTGQQIDTGVSAALNPDTIPTAGSDALMTSGGTKSALNTVDESIAIRVVGNKTTYASGAAIGQYVIVVGSTIAGITDGLYKAAKAIPYNTVIDSTYLTAVSGGGLNDIKSAFDTNFVLTFPIAVDKSITAGTWVNYSVKAIRGRRFNIALKSSAASGQFTVNVTGSVSGTIVDGALNHADYNSGNSVAAFVCQNDEIITFASYSNVSATVTCTISIAT